ncbi:sigma factor [Sphingopyxis sp.]|uniref:RNA polymerase sigma factor n=1 Tax=Sphingopyxis sp. TaxID=1908224 RepID=UPI0025D90E74|nr:sigma factor [Sphingopyxis sp.]
MSFGAAPPVGRHFAAMEPTAGLASLFDQHRGELLRFLRARCGNADDTDDCLQELWLKAANDPSGPIANGRAYLFRMANNLCSIGAAVNIARCSAIGAGFRGVTARPWQ